MFSNILHTFPRKPRLRIKEDDLGKPVAIVHLYMLPPFMAFIRDKAALLGSLGLLIYSIIYGLNQSFEQAGDWLPLILLPTLTYWPLLIAFEQLFTRRKKVTITQQGICYRKYLIRKHFDRLLPHSYVLAPHRFASLEKNWYDTRVRHDRTKQKAKFRKHYFQQSYVLCLVHAEISYEIAVIFDERRAQRCLSYLNSAEARIDGTSGYGKGYAIESEQEWRPQSGGLPEASQQDH